MPDYKKLRQIIQSIDSGKYKPANPPDSKELAMQALRAGNATSADSSLIFGLPKQNKVSDYELRNQRITSGKGSKIDSIAAGLLPRATAPNQNINWSKRLAENTYYKLGMKQNRNPQEEEAFQRASSLLKTEKEQPDELDKAQKAYTNTFVDRQNVGTDTSSIDLITKSRHKTMMRINFDKNTDMVTDELEKAKIKLEEEGGTERDWEKLKQEMTGYDSKTLKEKYGIL